MDDNARPHTAHIVQKYLYIEGITRMDWPARSLDLNPIEHLWNELQVRLSARQVQPRSLHYSNYGPDVNGTLTREVHIFCSLVKLVTG